MAANTDPRLQNQVIYSIYVRNHTSEGTFRAVIPDLDRIRALGTDIIWLMPIHPHRRRGQEGHAGLPLRQPRLPRRQPRLRHNGGL